MVGGGSTQSNAEALMLLSLHLPLGPSLAELELGLLSDSSQPWTEYRKGIEAGNLV